VPPTQPQPDEVAFRQEVRAWLAERRPIPPLPLEDAERHRHLDQWQRDLFDAGLCGLSFPVEYGGRGLSAVFDAILLEELGAAGAPSAFHYGYVARVLLEYGTDAQRQRFIRPALRGDEHWCQGFSEPDAGSDLASVRTRAVRDGNAFVVTGQKVWTSRAHWADWCLLLVRTGAPGSRHRGLSCLIVPTSAPGLAIRPFKQMTGGLEFAELFLDGVRVPSDHLVGGEGEGWRVAMSTVAYERGPSDVGKIADLRSRHFHLVEYMAGRGITSADPRARELARLQVALDVLSAHVLRGLREREQGRGDLDATSIDKLLVSETDQALARLEMDVHGADALLGKAARTAFQYLDSRAASIYGGSTQIQLGIIATRVLGLPRAG
jgi:alkylation response protein AidB-like acyl-CoA dehydrogenase